MRRLLLGLIALAAIGCDGANSLRSLNIGESKSLSPSAGGQTGPVRVYFTTPEKPPESSEIATGATRATGVRGPSTSGPPRLATTTAG